MSRVANLLVLAVACVVSSCTTSSTRQHNDQKLLANTTAALLVEGDANSLAAAAFLSPGASAGTETRLKLLAQASAMEPMRPNLAWLYLQECIATASCDPTPIEARLRASDPGNAAAMLGSLSRATSEVDTQRYVAAMAHSERLDIHWNSTIVDLTNATMKVGTMDLPSTVMLTIGYLAATAIPAYVQASNFCKGDRLRHSDVLAECRELAAVLRRGDTYITEMIGIAIARRVWPEESKEYQDAAAATRIAHYRMEVESKWNARHLKRAHDYQNYLALLAAHGREQDVFLLEIVNAGLNPNPSSDWQDPLLTRR